MCEFSLLHFECVPRLMKENGSCLCSEDNQKQYFTLFHLMRKNEDNGMLPWEILQQHPWRKFIRIWFLGSTSHQRATKKNMQNSTRWMLFYPKNMTAIPAIFWADTEQSASSMSISHLPFTPISQVFFLNDYNCVVWLILSSPCLLYDIYKVSPL